MSTSHTVLYQHSAGDGKENSRKHQIPRPSKTKPPVIPNQNFSRRQSVSLSRELLHEHHQLQCTHNVVIYTHLSKWLLLRIFKWVHYQRSTVVCTQNSPVASKFAVNLQYIHTRTQDINNLSNMTKLLSANNSDCTKLLTVQTNYHFILILKVSTV